MNIFVNSKKQNKYHNTIKEFSENNSFISSGTTHGYTSERYSWNADLRWKVSGNTITNPHSAYLSFYSMRESMLQTYGQVKSITDNYGFVWQTPKAILGSVTKELSDQQYNSISNKSDNFDFIEYLNANTTVKYSDIDYPLITPVIHNLGVALPYYQTGYKVTTSGDYDVYVIPPWWHYSASISNNRIDIHHVGQSFYSPNLNPLIRNKIFGFGGIVEKIVNCKLDTKSTISQFSGIDQAVLYKEVNKNFNQPYEFFNIASISDNSVGATSVISKFYPQVVRRGKLYLGKNTIDTSYLPVGSGYQYSYSGINSNLPDDQSRLIFNISRGMLNSVSGGFQADVDIKLERNRRHSSVVTTEPYMCTEPMCNGEVVDYSFVNPTLTPFKAVTNTAPLAIFLKIKAPMNFIKALDDELLKQEYNTDIIQTHVYNMGVISKLNTDTDIDGMGGGGPFMPFFDRQNNTLENIVNGTYKRFTINLAEVDYTDEATVWYNEGVGCVSGCGWQSTLNLGGASASTLNMYISNCETDAANKQSINIFQSDSDLTQPISKSRYELFRPMIKLPGMNGFVKIMKRSEGILVSRHSDGDYEVIYDVEFPYCPGSSDVRSAMDFTTTPYKSTQILKKIAYINAGSQQLFNGTGVRDVTNDRFAPYGDDIITRHDVLIQDSPSIDTVTGTSMSKIVYPAGSVWTNTDALYLGVKKFRSDARDGTYSIIMGSNDSDVKIVCLADNRKWKCGNDTMVSYVGRELPSYVFDIDVTTLLKDSGLSYIDSGSLPDIKRWLSFYFKGFLSTMHAQDIVSTRSEQQSSIIDATSDMIVSSTESESDVLIEIWDNTYNPDDPENQTSSWRPFSISTFDNLKVRGALIVDNLLMIDDSNLSFDDPTELFGDIRSVTATYSKDNSIMFPGHIGYGQDGFDLIHGKSNLILYHNPSGQRYHVVYVERIENTFVEDGNQYFQLYKLYYSAPDGAVEYNIHRTDNIVDGDYSLYYSKKSINKSTGSEVTSTISTISSDSALHVKTRYVDLKSSDDLSRYISNNKIKIRIRPLINNTAPVRYISNDESELQYVGSSITSGWDSCNYPWLSGQNVDPDQSFNWDKIKQLETIKKFGISYFNCSSR